MKQNIDIKKKAQSQNMQDKYSACESIQCRMTSISAIMSAGRGTQHLGRDGPPGRARSPGIIFREGLHPVTFTRTKAKVYMITTALCRRMNRRVVPEIVEGRSMNINILIKTKIQLFTTFNFLS